MSPLSDTLSVVDASLSAARAGTPTVLLIEGPPGSGKTTLLVRCRERAADFVVVAADALEPDIAAEPYSLLRDLGVDLGSAHPPAPLAAQAFAEWIDERVGTGPLLICIDDAQWADEQSVRALRLVFRRLEGTPALLAPALPRRRSHWTPWPAPVRGCTGSRSPA